MERVLAGRFPKRAVRLFLYKKTGKYPVRMSGVFCYRPQKQNFTKALQRIYTSLYLEFTQLYVNLI